MKAARAEEPVVKELTLIVYMCGSDLESRKGGASADLEEMENAGFDESWMNVLVLAGGAARWHSERVGRATFLMEIGKQLSAVFAHVARVRLAHLHDHKTCGGEENPADEDGREMDRRECGKEEQDK